MSHGRCTSQRLVVAIELNRLLFAVLFLLFVIIRLRWHSAWANTERRQIKRSQRNHHRIHLQPVPALFTYRVVDRCSETAGSIRLQPLSKDLGWC